MVKQVQFKYEKVEKLEQCHLKLGALGLILGNCQMFYLKKCIFPAGERGYEYDDMIQVKMCISS